MAQDQSIEAARAKIQRLVEEIAGLSKKDLRSEEFFQQFLARAVQATDARGGAVWLVGQRSADGKAEFQLAAQHDLESSLFHSDEVQHAILLRALVETVNTKRPIVSPPEPPAPAPGSLEAQVSQLQPTATPAGVNKTAFPFFHVPLLLKEQVLGVLQVWLQPYVTPQTYPEFVTFLVSLGTHVEQHLQSRRLGNLVLETQRLQHVLKFSSDIAGSLDPGEIARLAANYGRDLLGCERCSVLTLKGDRWEVLAISGQEVVEKKSSMVKAMVAFIKAHTRPELFLKSVPEPHVEGQPRGDLIVLSKKELIARAEAASVDGGNGADALASDVRATDVIDLAYFDHSHVVSAAIAPMLNQDRELIGAYFAESTAEGFFESAAGARDATPTQRLAEWLSTHTGRSLLAAQDYKSLPFLTVTRSIRDTRHALTGRHRGRFLFRTGVAAVILLGTALYPKMDQVDAACVVMPLNRAIVVPEVGGLVERIFVREGEHVTKGQPIAQLDKKRIETVLEESRARKAQAQAEADRLRALGDEASAQVAFGQVRVAEQEEKKLLLDLEATTLRSPLDGVILTKDLELHSGEAVQAGSLFAEVASMNPWELQLELNEKRIGRVEKALGEKKSLPVKYILYSQSTHKLEAQLDSRDQISAMAYPREHEQVFIITLRKIAIPEDVASQLRPGLTGRAKVAMGREPLIWWAAKRVGEWIRLRWLH